MSTRYAPNSRAPYALPVQPHRVSDRNRAIARSSVVVDLAPLLSMSSPVSRPRTTALPAHLDRGRLMTARELRVELFGDAVTEWWIRKNVAPHARITLGRSRVVWHEFDVRVWLLEQRSAA